MTSQARQTCAGKGVGSDYNWSLDSLWVVHGKCGGVEQGGPAFP